MVKPVEEARARKVWPVTNKGPLTVKAEEEAEPREEVAVAVMDVKEGLAITAIVEVQEMARLAPGVIKLAMSAKLGAAVPLDCKIWKAVPAEVKE